MKRIHADDSETPQNSIHGALQNLFVITDDIVKVARGPYQLVKYVEADDALASAHEAETKTATIKANTPGSEPHTEQVFLCQLCRMAGGK